MSDVLLTHGYFLDEDEHERQVMKPYPTLGLLYLSAYLKRAGVGVEIFDATFATRQSLADRLRAGRGIVGIYTNLLTRSSVLRLIAEAKRGQWTVVLGGPESANYPDQYLDAGADVIVIGEGEETMLALVGAFASRGPHRLHDVAGVAFRDEDGRIVRTPDRQALPDLDTLPWPDRDAIDLDRYVEVWRTHHGSGSVNLITARGCPYRCNWCSHAVFGFSHRRRSVRDVADEVQHLVERYRPDQLWYADDVFTIHHRWLFQLRDELARRGLRVPFETISRADRLMSDEVLEALADLGCYRIWIGSESGSQRILDAMQRGVTVEQVQWATHAAQRHGIEVGMFLMWGYDGETVEDIAATVDHVLLARPDVFLTTVSYPIMNTGYFEKVAGRVTLPGSWAEATDRDYQIEGRRDREYYRTADRWLKGEAIAARLAVSDPAAAARHREDAAEARAWLFANSPAESEVAPRSSSADAGEAGLKPCATGVSPGETPDDEPIMRGQVDGGTP